MNAQNARVAVMGAGAVGSYFGAMLARAGVDVTLIGRAAHVEAIRREGLVIDSTSFRERIRLNAFTDPVAVANADFVLFSAKTIDDEIASRAIAPHLKSGAVMVSLQNGVDNVERIRAASGIDAIPAVVYIAVALIEPGQIKHTARGELVIGELRSPSGARPQRSERCERVVELFTGAKVPCSISENIEGELWSKFVVNCSGNGVAAIGQVTYGEAVREPHTREVMAQLMAETVAVARASGVQLPQTDIVGDGLKFFESMMSATSSTARDIARGKPTEIESLNGFVVQRGKELGVPTPVNLTVHALVKLLEEKNARARADG
jgi:2-dehydropantoate 2-reductase